MRTWFGPAPPTFLQQEIMAAERGFYDVNPEPSRNGSHTDGPVLFKGSGRAVLTVFKFENWKEFLLRGDRPLTAAEVQRIEDAATLENFCIAGSITVEWPVVELEFHMDDFVGRKKRKTPFIVSARQNFATIMHPFTVDKEWMRFLGDKDKIRLNGYEWVFEQEKDRFSDYKGHIRHGAELFITFQFRADWHYHFIMHQ